MKRILKFPSNEPIEFKAYKQTDAASYSGYQHTVNDRKPLEEALAKEQGYICCYCNSRIEVDKMTVEHYKTQSSSNTEELRFLKLDYGNLLGSCRNESRDCSGVRGNKELIHLNPLHKDCESFFSYRIKWVDGKYKGYEIYAVESDFQAALQKEIDEVLRLNDNKLCIARQEAIEKEQQILQYMGKGFRTKLEIEKRIQEILKPKSKRFSPFCMAVIWYLRKKAAKLK